MVEDRLAKAAAAGELDGGPLAGKPLPDIDKQRPDGWWAEQFVRRERSHDRREIVVAAVAKARVGFWKATSAKELHDLVARSNEAIVHANINLVEADRVELFDLADIRRRWTDLARTGLNPQELNRH